MVKVSERIKEKEDHVAEIIFSHRSSLVGKELSMKKDDERPYPHEVYIVDADERKELEEISERLKLDDPARRKREQRY